MRSTMREGGARRRFGGRTVAAVLLAAAVLIGSPAARAGDEAPAKKPGATAPETTTITKKAETPRVRTRVARSKKHALHILDQLVVSVDFEEQRIADVARWLTNVTGVNVVLGPALLQRGDVDELKVDLSLKKVSARNVLDLVTESLGLAVGWRHGVLLVTTVQEARGKPVLKLYTVADLLLPIRDFPAPDLMLRPAGADVEPETETVREPAWGDADSILDLVRENVGGESWEDDGISADTLNDWLVIRQYPDVHERIADLLSRLRSAR